jgi:hypothetical protein
MWYDIEAFNTNEAVLKMRKIKSTTNKLDAEILNLVIEEKAAKVAINAREDITGYEKVCLVEQSVMDYGRKRKLLLAEKKRTEEDEAALLAVVTPDDGCDDEDQDEEGEEAAAAGEEAADVDDAAPDDDQKAQEGESEADLLVRKKIRVEAAAKVQGIF